jgi:hypothetical protein
MVPAAGASDQGNEVLAAGAPVASIEGHTGIKI